jgi:malonyl-CoA O-methyltransferase
MNRVDKARVQAAFSRGAARYDGQAVAQAAVRDRIAALAEAHVPAAARILDVGAGTGALGARLAARRPEARLALADLAQGMCEAARAAAPRATVVRADAEALPFRDASFDAVVSSSTFQWLPRLETALGEVHRALAPGGTLVLSLFAERTLHELRDAWREVAGARGEDRMHRFFTRGEVVEALGVAGLRTIAVEEAEIVERHADARAVLRAIRAIGAANAVPGAPSAGLGGRHLTLALLDRYDALHRDPVGVPATYHVVYAVARRD